MLPIAMLEEGSVSARCLRPAFSTVSPCERPPSHNQGNPAAISGACGRYKQAKDVSRSIAETSRG